MRPCFDEKRRLIWMRRNDECKRCWYDLAAHPHSTINTPSQHTLSALRTLHFMLHVFSMHGIMSMPSLSYSYHTDVERCFGLAHPRNTINTINTFNTITLLTLYYEHTLSCICISYRRWTMLWLSWRIHKTTWWIERSLRTSYAGTAVDTYTEP